MPTMAMEITRGRAPSTAMRPVSQMVGTSCVSITVSTSQTALGDRTSATEVFSQMVDYQLTRGQLSIKFLFRPASTAFWPDPVISAAYPYWLQVIARRVAADGTCLHLTGHTSTSGPAEQNDRLSTARAERIREYLLQVDPRLRQQITASGAGSRDAIVGTGRDDASDLVDRRVDFTITPCGSIASTRS